MLRCCKNTHRCLKTKKNTFKAFLAWIESSSIKMMCKNLALQVSLDLCIKRRFTLWLNLWFPKPSSVTDTPFADRTPCSSTATNLMKKTDTFSAIQRQTQIYVSACPFMWERKSSLFWPENRSRLGLCVYDTSMPTTPWQAPWNNASGPVQRFVEWILIDAF